MFYIVSYDIVDDKIRDRVSKVLKGYGIRVQKSVFECPNLTEKQFIKLKDQLERLIRAHEDSIRYYRQCASCIENFEISGIGEYPEVKHFKVV